MANQFYSSDALSELRRILLAPEFLGDALRPILADLLREQIAQVADEVVEELAPALREMIRETLRDELSAPSPELLESLTSALEPSIAESLRQRANGSARSLTALLRPTSRPAAEPVVEPQAPSETESWPPHEPEVALQDPVPEVPVFEPAAAEEAKGKPSRRGLRSIGGRHLLALAVTLLSTVGSGVWGWSKVEALMISGNAPSPQVLSAGAVLPVSHALYVNTATPLPWIGSMDGTALIDEAPAEATDAPTDVSTPESVDTVAPEDTPDAADEGANVPEATATPADAPSTEATPSPENTEIVGDSLPQVTATYVAGQDDVPFTSDVATTAKVIYLTFDDGPNAVWTPQVLEVLAQYNAHVTFFVIGKEAEKHPELVRAAVEAGHVVGHHTWSHPWLGNVDHDTFVSEITRTSDVLGDLISPYLRPPYGYVDENVQAYADELGLKLVRWNIDPADWEQPPAEQIANNVISHARPGGVVLLHDGGGNRSQTVAALPLILTTLGEQGYVFESVP